MALCNLIKNCTPSCRLHALRTPCFVALQKLPSNSLLGVAIVAGQMTYGASYPSFPADPGEWNSDPEETVGGTLIDRVEGARWYKVRRLSSCHRGRRPSWQQQKMKSDFLALCVSDRPQSAVPGPRTDGGSASYASRAKALGLACCSESAALPRECTFTWGSKRQGMSATSSCDPLMESTCVSSHASNPAGDVEDDGMKS